VASLPPDPSIVPLFRAVLERRVARFTYAGGAGEAERSVEPWRLEYRRGRWYLTAFDRERADERNFRLDRIRGAVALDDPGTFTGPPPGPVDEPDQPWSYGEGEAVTAVVRVDGDQARWARDQLGADTVTATEADGSTTFAVPVTSWPAFRSFVLSFLDHAEVLGPPDLRQDLVAWLEAVADDVQGGGS
jgi:predicted DNA-binding transcriptional regulator YafY